ncbi:hypothetical protein HMPREF3156_02114 [Neisseria sp. HMSC06F02]|nr:hypothetical protein HMPREF3156_02114 [Neisseria sp. HMSC06F02]
MGFMYYSSSKTSKSRADEIAGNPRPNIFLIKILRKFSRFYGYAEQIIFNYNKISKKILLICK